MKIFYDYDWISIRMFDSYMCKARVHATVPAAMCKLATWALTLANQMQSTRFVWFTIREKKIIWDEFTSTETEDECQTLLYMPQG